MQLHLFADWIPLPRAKILGKKWIPIIRKTLSEAEVP